MARWSLVFALTSASLAGCAAILGREDIVLEADPLGADGAIDGAAGDDVVVDDKDGSTADTGSGDAGPDGPSCPGVDAACTADAATACCPGMECRNLRCSPCWPVTGSCGGGVRCCGTTLRCDTRINKCVECIEAGVQCPITEANLCCSGNCSPVNGCF